ncbi:hypothetical protein [Sphingobium baderi]|uniref:hypothetical protein n=1 Tax=Sphingobium baderi TaxID=1332080 RepID=UPI002B40EF2C|nr:hypothetical protein [Sphingobium baderi]WRD78720.1 hypothetical protein QQ987_20255 [Sphingobium baderi]
MKARSSACLLTDIPEVIGRQGWPASRTAILTAATLGFAREHVRIAMEDPMTPRHDIYTANERKIA